jgi:hypothetical protein
VTLSCGGLMETHNCKQNKMTVRDGQVVVGCESCLPIKLSQGDSAAHTRQYQRRQFERDLIQPNMGREFIRAYGVDAAREQGYNEDTIRKLM